MLFRQYLDKDPVIATSYLFGCPTKGIGAVVDPVGSIDRYLKEAEEGNVLDLGNTQVEILHTPGHTPEHISLVVTDHARADEPWVVLTGHTLMVSDMGRTELATSAEEGARALFRSAEKLRRLPDHLGVFPGAFSGSVCGRGLSGNPSSTIGFERRHNRAFALESEEQFLQLMLEEIPAPPLNAARIRATNLGLDPARV
jgi:hydroxyacylglutathione hydrolase